MRKEEFFEVLGELNDDIVKGTGTHMKRKTNWKIWGTMAACLAIICAAAAFFFLANGTGEIAVSHGTADIAPMVYVNDTLYIQSSDQQGYPELKDEFVYLGKIKTTASAEDEPKENFQANDPIVGCEVYQYSENIVVYINGSYWLYVEYRGK